MNKEKIIEKNLGLIKKIAAKFLNSTIPQEDLIQEGILGLLQALERFDPKKEIKFSTYATFWIKKRIFEAVNYEKKQSLNSVHLIEETVADHSFPTKKDEKFEIPSDFPIIEKKILEYLFREELTLNEIADKMQLRHERVRQLKEKALRRLRAKKIRNIK